MKMTSAQAAKELRKLNDQHEALLARENKAREFTAAIQEDIETVRPAYDYTARQEELAALEEKTRKLKHAINCFNLQQEVPGFGMTIDQMLVYIPQLTARKKKLNYMRKKLPREREDSGYGRSSNIVEYKYANYDIAAVEADYVKTVDELSAAQNALDQVNSTVEFDVEM
ncbi:MAG: hypothetical protein IJI45_07400 [Anaerolineaceae bacterium]|nr:hypothetical protein [Anaerolineaceae bacterium]